MLTKVLEKWTIIYNSKTASLNPPWHISLLMHFFGIVDVHIYFSTTFVKDGEVWLRIIPERHTFWNGVKYWWIRYKCNQIWNSSNNKHPRGSCDITLPFLYLTNELISQPLQECYSILHIMNNIHNIWRWKAKKLDLSS